MSKFQPGDRVRVTKHLGESCLFAMLPVGSEHIVDMHGFADGFATDPSRNKTGLSFCYHDFELVAPVTSESTP